MGRGYARLTHIDEETGIEYVSEVNFPRNGLYTMLAPTCRLVSIEMPEPYPEFRSAAGDICIAMEQPSWAVAVYSRNGVYKLSVDSIYFDSNGDPT